MVITPEVRRPVPPGPPPQAVYRVPVYLSSAAIGSPKCSGVNKSLSVKLFHY